MRARRLVLRCVMAVALACGGAAPATALALGTAPTAPTAPTTPAAPTATAGLVPIAYRAVERGPLAGVQVLSVLDVSVVAPAAATSAADPFLPAAAGPLGAAFEVGPAGGRALALAGGALWDAAGGRALVRPAAEDGPLTGLALDPRGGVALVAGDALGVASGGAFLPIVELPGPGYEVAALADGTLVLWRRGVAGSTLLAVREARAAALARVDAPVDALAACGGRVLVAAGGAITALTPGEPTALIFAGLPARAAEDGIAADPARGTILLAGGGRVTALLGGASLPLAEGVSGPIRGALEDGAPVVYVLDRERRLLVRITGLGRIGGR